MMPTKGAIHEKLREQITAQILRGQLAAHDKLPSVKKLSGTFGISPNSVMDAVRVLERDGWVYRRKGSGIYVAEQNGGRRQDEPSRHTEPKVLLFEWGYPDRNIMEASNQAELLFALKEYLYEHGVLVTHARTIRDRQLAYLKDHARDMDVIILLRRSLELCRLIQDMAIPCISVMRLPEMKMGRRFDAVLPDRETGSYEATQFLIQAGHRKIAHLAGASVSSVAMDRMKGYTKALRHAGIAVDDKLIVYSDWTIHSGYEAMLKLFARGEAFTAVFAANDFLALGAMNAIRASGREIPGDVSILGFDDWAVSRFMDPPLTTMGVDRHRIGQLAAQMVLKRLEEPHREGHVEFFPAQLIERKSVRNLR